jgi:hypothetical protein
MRLQRVVTNAPGAIVFFSAEFTIRSYKVSRSVNKSDTVANIRIVTSLTSSRVSKDASGGFWGELLL